MRFDEVKALAIGAATYVPGAYSFFRSKRVNRDADRPEYFYGVWLKHLALLDEATGCGVPNVIVELGPGDTVGVGIAALLSGAQRYIGVDAQPVAAGADNDAIAKRLIELFSARAPFEPSGWPDFRHLLDDRFFPSRLLDNKRLSASLDPARLEAIRHSVHQVFRGRDTGMISYRAPMSDPSALPENSADLVLSHSVLEHIIDLPNTIRSTYRWLRSGGYASHQFDLRSHNVVRGWDGHRAFGDRTWKVVVGGRKFLINRLPFSAVVQCFENAGFAIVRAERLRREPTRSRKDLCKSWRAASDEDLQTEGGYIIAQKRWRAQ